MTQCAICLSPNPEQPEWFEVNLRDRQTRELTDFAVCCSWACMLVMTAHMKRTGGVMYFETDIEKQAVSLTLKNMGEYIGKIGWNVPFSNYSKEQAEGLIKAIERGYQVNLSQLQMADDSIPF